MNTPIIEVAKFDTILAQYEKIMSRPVFLSHLDPKKNENKFYNKKIMRKNEKWLIILV